MVERLYIRQYYTRRLNWTYVIKYSHWLELLHLFSHAKDLDLCVSRESSTSILSVLENQVGERATVVLPALQDLFFDKHRERPDPIDIEALIDA